MDEALEVRPALEVERQPRGRQLLERLTPVAASLGCIDELAKVWSIAQADASYPRQRRVAEEHDGDLRAVVDALIAELVL